MAGRRYGKGSSREHSPMAEWHAGIRLVVAESFERIYRQSADNVVLITTSDFSVIERVQRGEPLDLQALLEGCDTLTAAIVRGGGLMRYGQRHLQMSSRRATKALGDVPQPTTQAAAQPTAPPTAQSAAQTPASRAMTLVEKIIAHHVRAGACGRRPHPNTQSDGAGAP